MNHDDLCDEYNLENTTRKRKNEIFKTFKGIYINKLYSIMGTFEKRYHPYLLSEYDFSILKAIEKWTGLNGKGEYCSFKTYLRYWAIVKTKSIVISKYINYDRRDTRLDALEYEQDNDSDDTWQVIYDSVD